MDLFEAIVARRSIRKYIDKPVEFNKITKIIEAGRYAPSSGNLEDRRFILVTDKSLIEKISHNCGEQYWIATAPAVVIACALTDVNEKNYGLRGKRLYTVQNSAVAIENMMLAATSLGLGSCWIGAFNEEKIKEIFKIPDNVRPQAVLTFGYSDYIPKKRRLKPIENYFYSDKYGSTSSSPHLYLKDFSVEWNKNIQESRDFFVRFFKRVKKAWETVFLDGKNNKEKKKRK